MRVNIETGKEIYEYLFQKLSKLYRGEEELKPSNMKNYLTLLYTILDETDNCLKPRNYFSCNGNGRFILDCNEEMLVAVSVVKLCMVSSVFFILFSVYPHIFYF